MSLIHFNRRFPSFDRFFPEVLDTDHFLPEDVLKDHWLPAINVKENEKDFEIEVAAPGFKKEDFKAEITDKILTVSAEHKKTEKEETERYARQEFYYNSFKRTFTLPDSIDFDKKIDAVYENGVLRVHLNKLEALKGEEHKRMIDIA